MNLHQADRADWEKQKPETWNIWQRLAASTQGVVTLANIVSLAGGFVVIYGVYKLATNSLVTGTIAVLIGRTADILDGYVAHITQTKSPLGEAVDAAVDKILLGVTGIVLIGYGLVPLAVGILLLAHVIYNAILTALTTHRKFRLHPILPGKLATASEWIFIGLFIFEHYARLNQHRLAANILLILAIMVVIPYIGFMVYSSYIYTRQLSEGRSNDGR
jgi:phosphatidylglycerophosphate synthase